jgi:membrane protease YdiL (CAAX protease family)
LLKFFSVLTFGKGKIDIKIMLYWFCVGVFLYFISFLIYQIWFDVQVNLVGNINGWKILLSSVVLHFFVVAKEELLYRSIVLQVLDNKKTNKYLIIIVSALLFTLPHFLGYPSVSLINIFITGLLWGFIVYKEKGIEIVFALHFSSNIVVSVLLYLFDYNIWQIGLIFNLLSIILYVVYYYFKNKGKDIC